MFSQASVCPREGGVPGSGGMCGRGVHSGGHAWQGGHVWWGHVGQGEVHVGGYAWQRGHVWHWACMAGGMRGRRDGHCSGRYASYWNAFLFKNFVSHDIYGKGAHKQLL